MPRSIERRVVRAGVVAAIALATSIALGAAGADDGASNATSASSRPTYVRAFGTVGGGIGLRFNNPYRLEHQLGDDARGLSSTAPYTDLGIGATFGDPFGWQHGATLRWDRALTGIPQSVVTPSYVLLRRWVAFEAWGRFGFPIVMNPDRNLGTELAFGGAWFFTAGIGVGGELIGDLFFGAAIPDKKTVSYPILSGQLGVIVEWERLP
jgi:hypothetical protein